jgi:hypothetical protein
MKTLRKCKSQQKAKLITSKVAPNNTLNPPQTITKSHQNSKSP